MPRAPGLVRVVVARSGKRAAGRVSKRSWVSAGSGRRVGCGDGWFGGRSNPAPVWRSLDGLGRAEAVQEGKASGDLRESAEAALRELLSERTADGRAGAGNEAIHQNVLVEEGGVAGLGDQGVESGKELGGGLAALGVPGELGAGQLSEAYGVVGDGHVGVHKEVDGVDGVGDGGEVALGGEEGGDRLAARVDGRRGWR